MEITTKTTHPGVNTYNETKNLTQGGDENASVSNTQQTPFVNFVKDVVETSKAADAMAAKAVAGNANSLEVVQVMTDADRKISEFQQVWTRTLQSIQELTRQGA